MTSTAVDVEIVPSYIQDAWWTPAGDVSGTEVRDASTGDLLARVSTDGLDLAAAVEHGRTVGQASLGKLTFHQRALKLKELAQYLNARRDVLYEVSHRTAATKIDNMIDIDGGIGVLFTFGSKGRRELPNSQIVVDGPVVAGDRLEVDESSRTGEPGPVVKQIGDRLHSGTVVVGGSAYQTAELVGAGSDVGALTAKAKAWNPEPTALQALIDFLKTNVRSSDTRKEARASAR
jgi:class 3 adenylate cyclase